eukprot:5206157-Prymnesium_polylepis.3
MYSSVKRTRRCIENMLVRDELALLLSFARCVNAALGRRFGIDTLLSDFASSSNRFFTVARDTNSEP